MKVFRRFVYANNYCWFYREITEFANILLTLYTVYYTLYSGREWQQEHIMHTQGTYSPLTDGWIPPKFSHNGEHEHRIMSTSTTKTLPAHYTRKLTSPAICIYKKASTTLPQQEAVLWLFRAQPILSTVTSNRPTTQASSMAEHMQRYMNAAPNSCSQTWTYMHTIVYSSYILLKPLGLVARDELAKATRIQGNDANISTN